MKSFTLLSIPVATASPSSRGRGLKCPHLFGDKVAHMSPSSRGRGLKSCFFIRQNIADYVALFTRAWIEIFISFATPLRILSPSLRGRGLKYAGTMQERLTSGSPSLRGRGLKFRIPSSEIYIVTVALFARAWIEIMSLEKATDLTVVALFARAWIEILFDLQGFSLGLVALFARAWIEMN